MRNLLVLGLFVVLSAAPAAADESEPATLKGHSGWVGALVFSPDGATLASASADKTVRLWDRKTRKVRATLRGHDDYVCAVAYRPHGDMTSTARPGRIDKSQKQPDPLPPGEMLATGSYDWTVRVWDPKAAKELRTLRGHRGAVMAVAFRPDGRMLASGGIDGTVRLWDPDAGSDRGTLAAHESWVNGLAFSGDGSLLATAGSDATVKLWETNGLRLRATLPVRTGEVRSVALAPDGKTVAAGTRYGVAVVWDVGSGRQLATLSAGSGDVWAITFTGDGRTLVSGGGDWKRPGEIRLWDTATWRERTTLHHTGEVLCLAIAPKTSDLAAGSWDHTIRLWDGPLSPGRPQAPEKKP